MVNVSGASLGGIYDRLHDASEYPPLTAKTFADWSMEAGDIVTIQRDGKSYTSPAMNNTTVWRKRQQVSVNSTGKEKHDTVAKMSQRKFRGGSASLRATQKAFEQIITSYNEMTAGLILASSTAHLYVDNKYTQMTSGLFLTASTAKLYTDDRYRQMSSGLELSTSTAKLYVDNRYAQMTAGLELTSSTAKLYVDNKYAQMTAGLDLTSSTAKLYTDDKYRQMSSGLELSTSTAKLYVDNKYAQMQAGLDLTSSTAKLYVDNKYAQMTAGLNLTSSTAKLYVDNKYAQMTAGLDLTSSTAKLYTDNKYTQMSSGLALSTSSAKLYVDNKYAQMTAGLNLTSSTAKLYTDNKYAQMSSGLELSTSTAKLYVDNKYAQMSSGLALSTSSAKLYVDNKYAQMTAGLDMTSSSLSLYVDSKYSQMKAGLALSTSAAKLYADTVEIEAHRIKLDGSTYLDGVLSVSNGAALLNHGAIVSGGNLQLLSTANMTINGSTPGASYTLGYSDFETMIEKAEVDTSTNTLKLWKRGDNLSGNPSITFSKATSLGDEWSGNTYTVTAKQSGVTVGTKSVSPVVHHVIPQGQPSSSMNTYVATGTSGGTGYDDHGDAKTLYLVQDGLTVKLRDVNDTTTGTGKNTYAQTTIPNATVNGTWEGGTWTAISTHGGRASVSPFVQPVSSQGNTYVDLYVATSKSSSPYYDTHGDVKKLYLVQDGNYVKLRNVNDTSTGTGKYTYAQISAGGSSTPSRVEIWYADDSGKVPSREISSAISIKPYCLIGSTWYDGDTITLTPTGGGGASYDMSSVSANNDWPSSQSIDSFFGEGTFKETQNITFPSSANQYHRYIKFKIDSKWFLIYQ